MKEKVLIKKDDLKIIGKLLEMRGLLDYFFNSGDKELSEFSYKTWETMFRDIYEKRYSDL